MMFKVPTVFDCAGKIYGKTEAILRLNEQVFARSSELPR